ncbi:macro domain-containing protein [Vagococcus lutrae]|uniref:macro domain-containing protein n=1 Tax=Vagococcus lutrae TaxID=81947 RepID=UPI0023A9712A|nr:macro domain-containing protein [Vagococcus lutrae]WEB81025.1 DUF6430 domain-containing protein [Vagococcus lutrae]
MKVAVTNKYLRKQFAGYCATLTAIVSAFAIFIDIPKELKIFAGVIYVAILIIIYFFLWYKANKNRNASLKFGLTTVELKSGDIFEEAGLKTIAFNEYFDTQVDDKVIAKASLNGQLLLNYFPNVEVLDKKIEEDKKLSENIIEKDVVRTAGKTARYKLGSSILVNDEFILTAFSRFSSDNQAELTIQEYVNFLLNFWNEINRLYAQRSVTVPVFGAGITRFKNGFEDIDINELLKIMIWTFKISKIKFAYPAKLTILIHDDLLDKVNLYEIKESEQNGL